MISPEEAKAEQEALVEAKEDEVRANIIKEFGFDEVDNADLIDKAVARELQHRKSLSQAIGQKVKIRTERDELKKAIPAKKVEVDDLDAKLEAKLNAKLEERELKGLEFPDELKAEVKKVASTQGISVREALADPYIKFKLDAYEKEKKNDDASISRTNKAGTSGKFSIDKIPEVDMNTEEGRKEWENWKKEAQKQGF